MSYFMEFILLHVCFILWALTFECCPVTWSAKYEVYYSENVMVTGQFHSLYKYFCTSFRLLM